MKKKIIAFALLIVFCFALAGCGGNDRPDEVESDKAQESAVISDDSAGTGAPDDNETESSPDGKGTVYKLPVGAESEYALYETVVNFLNNGFHYDDLKDVYDPNLTLAFFSKWEREAEDIYTLGMDYNESCDLIARLRARVAEMALPKDEGGEIDEDLIDYDALQREFPPTMQARIAEEYGSFRAYFEGYVEYFIYDLYRDGEIPFYSDQVYWEKVGEDELETSAFDYTDWDADLRSNFPPIYVMELGEYFNEYSHVANEMYYTKIDGSYYFLSFTYAVSGVGG